MHAQDTAELFFADVHVPLAESAGRGGASYLVANRSGASVDRDRRRVAAQAALDWTLTYVRERTALDSRLAPSGFTFRAG